MNGATEHPDFASWPAYVRVFHDEYVRRSPLAVTSEGSPPTRSGNGPTILLFSPHPDDETLTGALAIRARRELNARVVNYAVTFGSSVVEKPRRLLELQDACSVLGFELRMTGPLGLDTVKTTTKEANPLKWQHGVDSARALMEEIRPSIVVYPHGGDWHPTHCGTSALAKEAVAGYMSDLSRADLLVVESEYWQPMEGPNLLVGLSLHDEALLLTALTRHVGEVARNPYHLSHPCRMIDNVRRGAEVVFGQGAAGVRFLLGELYRVAGYRRGPWKPTSVGPGEPLPIEP